MCLRSLVAGRGGGDHSSLVEFFFFAEGAAERTRRLTREGRSFAAFLHSLRDERVKLPPATWDSAHGGFRASSYEPG